MMQNPVHLRLLAGKLLKYNLLQWMASLVHIISNVEINISQYQKLERVVWLCQILLKIIIGHLKMQLME